MIHTSQFGDERAGNDTTSGRQGTVRVITLDRPEQRNALTPAGLDALETAVTEAKEPVVLLRGAGSAFCAGADLDVIANLEEPASFARHGQRVATAIETAEPVVIAGIDGAARGGGVELALAADIRVATAAATLGEPGVRLGIFGAWGGTARLPDIMGKGDALEFALSGRVLGAQAALRQGLVSQIVDDPREKAREIAGNNPKALKTVKRRLYSTSDQSEQEAAEAEAFARLIRENAADIAANRGG